MKQEMMGISWTIRISFEPCCRQFHGAQCVLLFLLYGIGNTAEEFQHLLANLRVVVADIKGMWAVNLCSSKILLFFARCCQLTADSIDMPLLMVGWLSPTNHVLDWGELTQVGLYTVAIYGCCCMFCYCQPSQSSPFRRVKVEDVPVTEPLKSNAFEAKV